MEELVVRLYMRKDWAEVLSRTLKKMDSDFIEEFLEGPEEKKICEAF